jgi:hypothetical protein
VRQCFQQGELTCELQLAARLHARLHRQLQLPVTHQQHVHVISAHSVYSNTAAVLRHLTLDA